MKAKEYYNKYEPGLLKEHEEYEKWVADGNNPKEFDTLVTYNLFQEMSNETNAIIESRHVKRSEGVMAAIKEMNGRWNAMATLFEKRHGYSPIKRNLFLNVWSARLLRKAEEKMAELEKKMKEETAE